MLGGSSDQGGLRSAEFSFVVALVAFTVLAISIATSPPHYCYDEVYHLGLTSSVLTQGWKSALLSPENASAAGPLYPALHLALSPVTRLRAPEVRWVNFVCLLLVVLMISTAIPAKNTWERIAQASSLLAVPFLWPACGLALTELPALVVFTGFVLLFQIALRSETISTKSVSYSALSGLLLGAAILGRQTYLVAIPAVLLVIFFDTKRTVVVSVCVVVAVLSSGWLFWFFGGLVPPSLRQVESGISVTNGIKSLSYVAAATLFINPRWLLPSKRKVIVVCAVIGGIMSWLMRHAELAPAKTLAIRMLGDRFGPLLSLTVGAIMIALGLVWAWQSLRLAWERRDNVEQVFLFMLLFFLVAVPMKVSHLFSSRYVVGLLGVLIVLMLPLNQRRAFWTLRMVLGVVIGAATLKIYYNG
jgi:hypothetical protein